MRQRPVTPGQHAGAYERCPHCNAQAAKAEDVRHAYGCPRRPPRGPSLEERIARLTFVRGGDL